MLQAFGQAGESADHWTIEILGTDVSAAMIGIARQGVYGGPGLDAFRQLPEDQACYFDDVENAPGRRRVANLVHALPPRFHQHNLMDATPPIAGADIVLCRSVFVYFDDESQRQALSARGAALRDGGFLLLGVTDRLAPGCGFVRESTGTAVIYRLAETAP